MGAYLRVGLIRGGLKFFLVVGHIRVEVSLQINDFLEATSTNTGCFKRTFDFSLINDCFFFHIPMGISTKDVHTLGKGGG